MTGPRTPLGLPSDVPDYRPYFRKVLHPSDVFLVYRSVRYTKLAVALQGIENNGHRLDKVIPRLIRLVQPCDARDIAQRMLERTGPYLRRTATGAKPC